MYKNALDLYQRLSNAAQRYNEINKMPSHICARVDGDQFTLTKTQILYLQIPVPGNSSMDFEALVNYDHVRIVKKNGGMSVASIELDLEYHTFMGFSVNNGVLMAAFKYELPAKYDTIKYAPLSQNDWEKLIAKETP